MSDWKPIEAARPGAVYALKTRTKELPGHYELVGGRWQTTNGRALGSCCVPVEVKEISRSE